MATALSIAGSDSIGGAGIQADIKAMSSLGVHATTVVTALTAQNTCRVSGIHAVPPEFIAAQLRAVLEDADLGAAKTGMLYCADAVDVVVELWPRDIPLVVDPVMVAGVGDRLHRDDLVSAIRDRLIPIAAIVTPNRMEAEELSGITIDGREAARRACEAIGASGAAVLLKGGHMGDEEDPSAEVVDFLYHEGEHIELSYPRLDRAGHGGGCTLASFIASHLALGHGLRESVIRSRRLIQRSIASMLVVGKGERLVDPQTPLRLRWEEDSARMAVLHALRGIPSALKDKSSRFFILQMYEDPSPGFSQGCFSYSDGRWSWEEEGALPPGMPIDREDGFSGRVWMDLDEPAAIRRLPPGVRAMNAREEGAEALLASGGDAIEAMRLLVDTWCRP